MARIIATDGFRQRCSSKSSGSRGLSRAGSLQFASSQSRGLRKVSYSSASACPPRGAIVAPAHLWWQGHEDRLGTPAGLQAEQRAAVIDQVELDVPPRR